MPLERDILVADCSNVVFRQIERALAPRGCRLTHCKSAAAAWAHLRARPCGLVFANVSLSESGELDFLREIRRDASLTDCHVVLLSASPADRLRREAIALGAADLLPIPFTAEAIEGCVSALLHADRQWHPLRTSADSGSHAARGQQAFLADVSQEVRAPLTAILQSTDRLLEMTADSRQIEHLRSIRRHGKSLIELLGDLVDLSMILSGRITLERERCSPIEIATDALAQFRERLIAKGLAFGIDFRGPIPATIETDATRLRQVLGHLIGNAVRFTHQGSIRIVLEASRVETNQPILALEIHDTGCGIDADRLTSLFEPFLHTKRSEGDARGGSGLGLAISQRLAEMLGGSIKVASKRGVGSTFRVEIATGSLAGVPIISQNAASAPLEPRQPSTLASPTRRAGRILLAEDGVCNQRVLAFRLQKAGYEVIVADNGRQAVDFAEVAAQANDPFGIILMDMEMPELDGYDATVELRAKGHTLPIVALTAHSDAAIRDRCLTAGCDDFLTKPCDHRELLAMVERHLQHSAPRLAETITV